MSTAKEDTLRQFCDVTGADDARSRFFLESSNWQLDVALSSFYEHGGNVDEVQAPTPIRPNIPTATLSDSDMESPPGSPQKPQKKEKPRSNAKFATLDSLQKQESSSDEEEGQAFYAGGSERSGQQIIGPGKNRKDIVTDMFKSVRERGAVVFDEEPATVSGRGRGAFSGTGYRLGQTPDDHEPISSDAQPQDSRPGEPRSVRLRLYREGFTVDGGEMRHYTDPENAEFLGCIRRGEIPPELSHDGEVRVALEDRRLEQAPSALRQQAFTGKGHMLGSPTPATVGVTAPVASDAADRAANQRVAQTNVRLDETQPITTIQFRLADGSRITGRFNHTHTVSDLQQFVATAEPAYQITPFALLTAYPSAELTDANLTLDQGKLLNTTLLQRVK